MGLVILLIAGSAWGYYTSKNGYSLLVTAGGGFLIGFVGTPILRAIGIGFL